jgi:hypothetical protein
LGLGDQVMAVTRPPVAALVDLGANELVALDLAHVGGHGGQIQRSIAQPGNHPRHQALDQLHPHRLEGDIRRMPADFPVTELWQVLQGRHPGRRDASQVTVFDSVGFALEDYSALCFMGDAALELGIGGVMELVPQLRDPKDLFGLLRPSRGLHLVAGEFREAVAARRLNNESLPRTS